MSSLLKRLSMSMKKKTSTTGSSATAANTASSIDTSSKIVGTASASDSSIITNKSVELTLSLESQVTKDHYTPRGVLLSALIRMKRYGVLLGDGKTIKCIEAEWTTEKMVYEIIRPNAMNTNTNQQWAIFTDIIKDRSLISPTDFEAVFVSHAWAYNFTELLGILERIANKGVKEITADMIDKEIPNELDEMYGYLLKPLKNELGEERFNKAFSTILASRVPLNIDIWKQIVLFIGDKGEKKLSKLKREYGHLFVFGDDVVRVVHKSQTEYLEEIEHGLSNGLRVQRQQGHQWLSTICDDQLNIYLYIICFIICLYFFSFS